MEQFMYTNIIPKYQLITLECSMQKYNNSKKIKKENKRAEA